MRINVRFYEDNETLNSHFHESTQSFGMGFDDFQVASGTTDYNRLKNKPSINSVELVGVLSAEDLGLGRVYYDTTANWDAQRGLIGIKGAVYIYSDHEWLEDDIGNRIPVAGIRVGDGSAYLNDLPFVTDAMTYTIVHHIADTTVHVTPQEKAFWNNKVSSFLDRQEEETLILSKTHYEDNGELIAG